MKKWHIAIKERNGNMIPIAPELANKSRFYVQRILNKWHKPNPYVVVLL
jgi:hypothetical protein